MGDGYSYVKDLKLYSFRNYISFQLDKADKVVVLLGKNGSGKTNILESISLLAKGKGIRGANIVEMQNYNTNDLWAIHYNIQANNEDFSIGMARKHNDQRLLLINDKVHSNYNLLSKIINIIWLVPELDHIFLKSPSDRLKFFDRVVNIFEDNYYLYLIKYNKVKSERSRLLKNNSFDHNWLSSLEKIIAINGINIILSRIKILKMLQNIINNNTLIKDFPKIKIEIKSQISHIITHNTYDNAIEIYCQNLKNNRIRDTLTNRVGFGIHNDKLEVINLEKNILAHFCSTGEQKIMLLLIIISATIGKYNTHQSHPILLLDDIMSHLDDKYRSILLETIVEIGCQTWITDINDSYFNKYKGNFNFFNIQNDN